MNNLKVVIGMAVSFSVGFSAQNAFAVNEAGPECEAAVKDHLEPNQKTCCEKVFKKEVGKQKAQKIKECTAYRTSKADHASSPVVHDLNPATPASD